MKYSRMLGIAKPKRAPRQLFAAAVVGIVLLGAPLADETLTKEKIYPGVSVASVKIGGMAKDAARAELQTAFDEFRSREATFVLEDTQTALRLGSLLTYDLDAALSRAATAGRNGNLFKQIKDRAASRAKGIDLAPEVGVSHETLASLLTQTYGSKLELAQDANFTFTFIGENPPIVAIQPGKNGSTIDTRAAAAELVARAQSFSGDPIKLKITNAGPVLSAADLEPLLPQVRALFERPPTTVTAQGKKWTIDHPTLAGWVSVTGEAETEATLYFNQSKLKDWLDKIAPQIEKNPTDALFELDPDRKKVVKFQIGAQGTRIPRDQNAARVAEALKAGASGVELAVTSVLPQIASAKQAEQYGIKQLLGRATTNFKGSPPNRVKNIARGAEILYGVLIAPDEEFSLLDRLRPFTLENGYLSELVIKAAEGRTVPEIGGGLCQIGTTMFRTALAAGLPITARRNHSYRVSYYEPPVGMDATIYDPAPDFKFKNDTGNWLLLTTYVDTKTMDITFELWGTDDGRKAEATEPEVFNFRKPPEAKIIETTELAPGVKKCTERAHIGSDAKFTYTVTYPDGTVKEEEFFSRYRPWQEVCLLGVEAKAGEEADTTQGEALPDTLPSADALGVVGNE